MPVYVDPIMPCQPTPNWRYDKSCHMFADTLDELHSLANRIGLKRAWFQDKRVPHYDLTEGKRLQALQHGAVPLTREETVAKWQELGFIDPDIKRLTSVILPYSFVEAYFARVGGAPDEGPSAVVLLFKDQNDKERPILLSIPDARRLIFESLRVMKGIDAVTGKLYDAFKHVLESNHDTNGTVPPVVE